MEEADSGLGPSAIPTLAETATGAAENAGDSRQRRTRGRARAALDLERGDSIGRYLILHRLGAGGMGVVYAAYDPELDRRVALKLLRTDGRGSTGGSVGEARLLREARAMAKLAAPNVVTVHDIGTFEDQVYVAMEFVDGGTLADWFEREHDWREALDVFRSAGRGLAAAHAAGLIHRDFKPDNVMLANDGRILVMDFGLVRGSEDEDSNDPEADELVSSSRPGDARLTRAGAVMGTPAYMAPEQHLGMSTDARTDQFSFCVALYEALFGERPFRGDTLAALAFQVTEGNVKTPPADTKVPAWLRRVVSRGLSSQPDDRYPSMDVLLAELDRDPAVGRRRWLGFGAAGLAIAGVAFGISQDDAGAQLCTGAEEELVGIWDEARKREASDAFSASGVAYATDTWARVESRLDEYTAQWTAARVEACEATAIRGEQSAKLLDLRMACLGRRLEAVDALVDIYVDADAALVPNAVVAASKLPRLDMCSDAELLLAEVPPPEDEAARAQVEDIRRRLVRAQALDAAGRYADAIALADPAWEEARELGYGPVEADAAFQVAALRRNTGDYAGAETAMSEAILEGRASKNDRTATKAMIELAGIVALLLDDPDRAQVWLDLGAAEAERHDDDYMRARLEGRRAHMLDKRGDYPAAITAQTRALSLLADTGRERTIDGAVAHNNHGATLFVAGDYEQAEAAYAKALEISRAELGELHPAVASTLGNLGLVARARGDLQSSRANQEEALRLKEGALGPDHPSLAYTLDNLGVVLLDLGDPGAARTYFERSLAIRTKALGDDHVDVANTLAQLGNALAASGEPEEALALQLRALGLVEKTAGADDSAAASYHDDIGRTLTTLGRWEDAVARHERALTLRGHKGDGTHPEVAVSLLRLAEALMAGGQPASALEPARRGLALADRPGGRKDLTGDLRFVLARALDGSGDASKEATVLLEQAQAAFVEQGRPADAKRVGDWASEHRSAVAQRR